VYLTGRDGKCIFEGNEIMFGRENKLLFFKKKIKMTRNIVLCLLYADIFFRYLMIFAVPTAACIILLRIFLPANLSTVAPIIFAMFAFSFFIACKKIQREKKNGKDIAAWLDYRSSAGGFLMTIEDDVEKLDRSWEDVLEKLKLIRIDVRAVKLAAPLAAACLFVVLSIVIPIPEDIENIAGKKKLNITNHLDNLELKVELMSEMNIIEEEKKSEIVEEIEKLRENDAALQPAKIFENLDALDAALKEQAETALANFANTAKILSDIENSSGKLKNSPDENSARQMRDVLEKLTKFLEDNPGLMKSFDLNMISEECFSKAFMKSGILSDIDMETLKKIASAAKNFKGEISSEMKKLCDAGLCSKTEELEKFLAQIQHGAEDKTCQDCVVYLSEEQEKDLYGNLASCGEITRGRGDAPMFFGSESPEITQEKQEKIRSELINPEIGESLGIFFGAPEANETEEKITGTSSSYSVGKGGVSKQIKIPPSEKKIFKKYFAAEDSK
jgi:hypothetical protein